MYKTKQNNISQDAVIASMDIKEVERRFDDNFVFNSLPLTKELHDQLYYDLINNKDDNIEDAKKNKDSGSVKTDGL